MMKPDRMYWLQSKLKDREERRHGAVPIGQAFDSVVDSLDDEGQRLQLARRRVDAVVDDYFREHCRVEDLFNGLLTVAVDHPLLLSAVRMQWGERLKREAGVSRVRYVLRPGEGVEQG